MCFRAEYAKRIIDIFMASIGILMLSPLFLLLAVLVRINIGSPILFKQLRPGLHQQAFVIFKFRSMRFESDQFGNELPDAQRLTKFGKFLRSTSLDELPELYNVLKGDMSIVGPRPLLVEYLPLYTSKQLRRHEVRPGITGWAQVNGRNVISWEEKFKLDVWYIDNRSFCLDVKILMLTVWKVLSRDGISADGDVTMPKFNG